jgi:enoyl-CoA hydratase/carnithine racemase
MVRATAQSYRFIRFDSDGAIARVTMDRPERRNALSVEHMRELIDCFRAIGATPECAVAILRGNGPAFCAGHDLRELVGRDAPFYRGVFEVCTELMETIQGIPQPVIAQVQGMATAAGCQLAATCDLVVAAEDARFATPGVTIGLFCSTPMVALTRAVGRKKALELLLTGEPISAQEALAHGLVNRIVPAAELDAAAGALAERIAAASRAVVGLGKQAFYRQIEAPQAQAYADAQEVMTRNALLADAQEGMCAFLEKREPHWAPPDGGAVAVAGGGASWRRVTDRPGSGPVARSRPDRQRQLRARHIRLIARRRRAPRGRPGTGGRSRPPPSPRPRPRRPA